MGEGQHTGREPLTLRFSRTFLRFRVVVMIVFAIATVAAALCIPRVAINYSLADYLPQDAPSTRAIDTMQEVYGTGIPNARLYAEGLTLSQASQLDDALTNVDGVEEVMWLGTQVDVKVPIETQDADAVSAWKTDDGYLYQLVIDAAVGNDAIAGVRAAATDAGATRVSMDGDLVSTVSMQESTSVEVVLILLAGIAIIVGILLLGSHSWFEPVVFMVPIGVAIVLNMGSNIVMGEISFVSQISGAILQLAVSMDYAIVFLHRFRNMQHEFTDPVEAMAHCMQRSFSIELSSAAVTFFGFLSLTIMRFGIGVDLGIVLAKGIALSFVSVIFLMPCLILLCLPVLDKLNHRYLVPSLDKLSRGLQRIAAPMAIVIVIIAVPCYLGEDKTGFIFGSSDLVAPDSQAGIESQHIEDASGTANTWVLMVPEGQWGNERGLVKELQATEHVSAVTSYITTAGHAMPADIVPADQLEQLIKDGWSRIVVTTDVEGEGDVAFGLVETVRSIAQSYYGDDYLLAGSTVNTYDLKTTTQSDAQPVKMFTMLSIGIVLAIMFRSLTIPLLILAAIEVSIWINLAIPYFMGTSLNYIGYLVIDSVQMGASVDYAIVLAREYFDRRRSMSAKDASRDAVTYAGVPIMTSAIILIMAGASVQFISSNGIVSELGMLIFRGAFISMLMMFLFLPFLFRLFDGIVRHTSIGLHAYDPRKGTPALASAGSGGLPGKTGAPVAPSTPLTSVPAKPEAGASDAPATAQAAPHDIPAAHKDGAPEPPSGYTNAQ
ncbi:MAG: MMPL family transporter [Coriobacteriia bacterium]|nr:MMPL family transporter [Coriobacteriia bacterium]